MKQLGGAGAILAVVIALLAAACGGTSNAANEDSGGGKLTLVAYSTPQEAYEAIIPAFQKTAEGKGVEFALDSDITRLVDAGLVDSDWSQNEYKGILTDSVVSFVVRKGNPDDIQTWDDLLKPGVEVVTPNPFTSGGARWNVMAGYGAQLEQGKTPEQARDYLKALFANVAVQDKSARESLTTFASGKGDVLLGYENEAIFAQRQGQPLEYVVPEQTILIENPVAITEDANGAAKGFLNFLTTDEAQQVFGDEGYRPVVKSVLDTFDFPTPPGLFTIADVGGWNTVQKEFFDREDGFMADVQRELGQPTE